MSDLITEDMIIRDVRDRHPGVTAVFQAHGLPCAGCQVGASETVAQGARTHKLDVAPILADLNRFARDGTVPTPKSRPAMTQAPRRDAGKVEGIKHIIAIVSGKGGVGKSLVTALLAVTLKRQGYSVGILDGDITGPSIPLMFNIPTRSLVQADDRPKPEPPRSKGGIAIMSMNVLLPNAEDAVVWRGPMISNAIKQFYTDMDWGTLDYLLIDLPPGTSDAPMTVMQQLPTDGAVIVSSPQGLATMVVSKAIQMVQKFEVPIVGVVENMSYVTLPDGTPFELFGPSQGQRLVGLSGAPLLGRLPIDPSIAAFCDAGRIEDYTSEPYDAMARNFLTRLDQRKEARPSLPIVSSRSAAGATAARAGATPLPPTASTGRTPLPPTAPRAQDRLVGADASGVASTASREATVGTAVGMTKPEKPVRPVRPGRSDKGGALLRLGRFLKQEKA